MYQKELETAIKAVTQAADLCVNVRTDMVNPDAMEKGDRSPVTIADFGAQAIICKILSESFPDDVIVGEEDTTALQKPGNAATLIKIIDYIQQFYPDATEDAICEWIDRGTGSVAERYWTVDPIDGTKGFLRNDQYAIALALVENGEVKVGALACPALSFDLDEPDSLKGVLFTAVRGEGSREALLHSDDFTPIHVVSERNPDKLRFLESVEAGHANHALNQAIARAVGIVQPSLRMDSQAKYGALARGDATLYLRLPSEKTPNYAENIWDHAAGSIIAEEAGGKVSDMYGRPLDFSTDRKMRNNRGVIVSNGSLHQAVLNAIAEKVAV